jgi:hypothetical protein
MADQLTTPPDYTDLSGPRAYTEVEADRPWDSRFLELVKPERTYSFGDFVGVESGGPSAFSELAITVPFRVLNDEGVAIVQEIIDELEAHAITSERTPKYVSGAVYRSQFLRGFYSDPALIEFLSGLAQVPLSPFPVPYQALHLNYAPEDITQNVDKWHTDSVAFNWVMMVSDPRPMKGGELQAYLGVPEEGQEILSAGGSIPDDRVMSVDWPGPGWCVFQQGHRLLHQVTPLQEPYRRMTMVGSYYTSVPGMPDPIDRKPLDRLKETADRDYTLVEWSRHKALLAAQELHEFAATKTDFRQPIDEVRESLRASISDVQRVLAAFDA